MNKLLGGALLLAILPLSYGYYEVLRVVVTLGCIYLLVRDWKTSDSQIKGILIVISILFNPISPIYLSKMIWVMIDLIAGLFLLGYEES